MVSRIRMFVGCMLCVGAASGEGIRCELSGYKAMDGLRAQQRGDVLEVNWQGERKESLRASFAVVDGQPMV